MNETTKALFDLLLTQNNDEMCVMFKEADGIESFAVAIETYVRTSLIEEVEWDKLAQGWAEMPF